MMEQGILNAYRQVHKELLMESLSEKEKRLRGILFPIFATHGSTIGENPHLMSADDWEAEYYIDTHLANWLYDLFHKNFKSHEYYVWYAKWKVLDVAATSSKEFFEDTERYYVPYLPLLSKETLKKLMRSDKAQIMELLSNVIMTRKSYETVKGELQLHHFLLAMAKTKSVGEPRGRIIWRHLAWLYLQKIAKAKDAKVDRNEFYKKFDWIIPEQGQGEGSDVPDAEGSAALYSKISQPTPKGHLVITLGDDKHNVPIIHFIPASAGETADAVASSSNALDLAMAANIEEYGSSISSWNTFSYPVKGAYFVIRYLGGIVNSVSFFTNEDAAAITANAVKHEYALYGMVKKKELSTQ